MNVHNLMEELVYTEVNDLFDTAKANKAPWLTCNCSQCRLDTICYVLNRIPPHYIKSGRGLAYSQQEESVDTGQLSADISRLGLEGMKQVLSSKRPHTQQVVDLPETPVFNFPTLVGKILDGLTFEPIKDISVLLLLEAKKAVPIDSSWENPCKINSHTPGTFNFWVKPVAATREGENRVFPFEIKVEKQGFDSIDYYFEIGVTSESVIRTAYNSEHSYMLPDLHMFPVDTESDKMQD